MEWISHTATGFFLGQALVKPEERPRRAGWWWSLAAISPDWLEFGTRWFGDIHRGVTHSLYVWPFLALAWAVAARRWGGENVASLGRLWSVFFVVIGSHLLLDVFMSYRLYLAWPFTQTRWAWDIMPLFDIYIFAGWLVMFIVNRWIKLPSVTTAKIGLAIFLLIFTLRIGAKARAHTLALDFRTGPPTVDEVRTIPDYFQPWVWYARLPQSAAQWTPINVLTGQILSGEAAPRPWSPWPYWRQLTRSLGSG